MNIPTVYPPTPQNIHFPYLEDSFVLYPAETSQEIVFKRIPFSSIGLPISFSQDSSFGMKVERPLKFFSNVLTNAILTQALQDLTDSFVSENMEQLPLIKESFSHYLNTQYDCSLKTLNQLIEKVPNCLYAYSLRAFIYFEIHHNSLAINDCLKAISLIAAKKDIPNHFGFIYCNLTYLIAQIRFSEKNYNDSVRNLIFLKLFLKDHLSILEKKWKIHLDFNSFISMIENSCCNQAEYILYIINTNAFDYFTRKDWNRSLEELNLYLELNQKIKEELFLFPITLLSKQEIKAEIFLCRGLIYARQFQDHLAINDLSHCLDLLHHLPSSLQTQIMRVHALFSRAVCFYEVSQTEKSFNDLVAYTQYPLPDEAPVTKEKVELLLSECFKTNEETEFLEAVIQKIKVELPLINIDKETTAPLTSSNISEEVDSCSFPEPVKDNRVDFTKESSGKTKKLPKIKIKTKKAKSLEEDLLLDSLIAEKQTEPSSNLDKKWVLLKSDVKNEEYLNELLMILFPPDQAGFFTLDAILTSYLKREKDIHKLDLLIKALKIQIAKRKNTKLQCYLMYISFLKVEITKKLEDLKIAIDILNELDCCDLNKSFALDFDNPRTLFRIIKNHLHLKELDKFIKKYPTIVLGPVLKATFQQDISSDYLESCFSLIDKAPKTKMLQYFECFLLTKVVAMTSSVLAKNKNDTAQRSDIKMVIFSIIEKYQFLLKADYILLLEVLKEYRKFCRDDRSQKLISLSKQSLTMLIEHPLIQSINKDSDLELIYFKASILIEARRNQKAKEFMCQISEEHWENLDDISFIMELKNPNLLNYIEKLKIKDFNGKANSNVLKIFNLFFLTGYGAQSPTTNPEIDFVI